MKLLLLLLVVFGALPLFGQGTSFPVFNRQGWTMAGAAVSVCNGPADPGTNVLPCVGSQTTTYTDWTLSVACTNLTSIPNPPGPPMGPTWGAGCTNPGLTDSHGNATIFAANGFYWAQIAGYQVVPQTFPFNIGSGGGGGGLIPCGVVNDVQLYGTPGILGCDTGILIGNPSTHTLSDNILNANQQVQVGDTTNTGKEILGYSNGSSILAGFTFSLSPTFSTTGGGYGVDFPDAAPSTSSCLTTTGSIGLDGRFPTAWGACGGGGGGGVSLEYEYPLDFTNAPSPTTSNDLVRTLWPQGTSQVFMGPLPSSVPKFFVVQDVIAGISSTGNVVVTLPNPVIPGDILFAVSDTICGLFCSEAFTFTDSLSNSFILLDSTTNIVTPTADAYAKITTGGQDTVTVTVSSPGGGDSTNLHVVEITGVSVLDTHSMLTGVTWSTPGSPSNLPAVTTTTQDIVISSVQSWNSAQNIYTSGSGLAMVNQINTTSGPNFDDLGTEATYQPSIGAYTPTIIGTRQPTGGSAGPAYSVAFKYVGTTGSQKPFFRNPELADQVAQGWLPDPTGQSGKCLSNNGLIANGVLTWIACGSGGGDTITSPNSTLTVGGTSSATTLDVAGAAGKIMAGATPALTYNPILGIDGSNPGTLQLANNSSPFHTVIGTQASANWTFKLPATAGINQYVLETDGSGNTSWVAQNASGDSLTSPNSTINIGGTSAASTIDLAGAAGKIMAGATPGLTFTPQLGVDNTNAGTLALSNGSAIAHTILGSAATTTNTILGPAVVIPNGHLLECSTSSTTCTLTDGGTPATFPTGPGVVRVASGTPSASEISGDATTSGSNALTLATVNSNVGSFTSANITVNAKGLITAAANGTGTTTIASGTAAMGTSGISSGTCASAVTVSATGVTTTDAIIATPNADPTGVTGYAVSASGSLYIQAYPTSNNVNFKVCNNTGGTLTPSALTLNWRVVR